VFKSSNLFLRFERCTRADTKLLCNSRARRLGIAGRWNFNKQSGGNPREAERDTFARGNKQRTILFAYQINELFERPALFMVSP
jgi:hypothetical protein